MPALPTTQVNTSGHAGCGICISHHESCVNRECKCNDGFIRNSKTCIGKVLTILVGEKQLHNLLFQITCCSEFYYLLHRFAKMTFSTNSLIII